MTPVPFPAANKVFAAGDSQRLPAHVAVGGLITTCWHLSLRQRLRLLWSGRLWAQTTSPTLGLDLDPPELPRSSPRP
jgi:hypothetical protein